MTYEQVQSLKPEAFKRLCGVGYTTFAEMVSVLKQQQLQKRKPGRPPKLSLEDQVLLALQYWREYRTYFHIAQSWNINESTAFRIVRHVEDTLIRSGRFSLPGKKALLQPDSVLEVVVVDVTESPVERPKKKQRQVFSGKKKYHTLKSQLVVNQKTGAIICIAHGKGRRHDFRLFKSSKVRLANTIKLLGDKGYQGIAKLHANSQIPTKKPKSSNLSQVQRQENRTLASERIIIEHVNRRLKIFRILSERYRNRRRRFGLRFNLIAGIYNYELNLS